MNTTKINYSAVDVAIAQLDKNQENSELGIKISSMLNRFNDSVGDSSDELLVTVKKMDTTFHEVMELEEALRNFLLSAKMVFKDTDDLK